MKHSQTIQIHRILTAAVLMLCLMAGTAAAAPILSENSHGHDVMVLQQELKRTGYLSSSADGLFGNATKRAVLAFQRDQKMKITGIVDGSTWRALKKATPRSWGAQVKPVPPAASNTDNTDNTVVISRAPRVPESKPFLDRSKVSAIISTAKKYIGVPYKFGGTTPKAFDCSGYLQYVFAQNGLSIPRTADEQFKLGRRTMSSSQLEPGDLVFFTTYESGASHCGIYLGSGKFIHASSSRGVRIDELSNTYWQPKYYGGKHIIE